MKKEGNMIKNFIFDIDGTLVNSNYQLTDETYNVLTRLKNSAYNIVLCTGRNVFSSLRIFNNNPVTCDFLIACNGSIIYDIENKTIINEKVISSDMFFLILNYCAKKLDKAKVISENGDYEISLFEQKHINFYQSNIYKIELSFSDNININLELLKLKQKFKELSFTIMKHSKHERFWIEVSPLNVSKLGAVKYFFKLNNMDMNETVFFGDSLSDVELLKSVGLGVAMKNGTDTSKEVADEICLSNDEDGVSKWLNENILAEIKIDFVRDDRLNLEIANFVNNIMVNEFKKENKLREDILNICEYYNNKVGRFWYASYNNKVVGTIALEKSTDNNAVLKRFYVANEFRNKGIAKRMFEKFEQFAVKNKIKAIYLATSPSQQIAHNFYKKMGFHEVDSVPIKMSYSDDDLLFIKLF